MKPRQLIACLVCIAVTFLLACAFVLRPQRPPSASAAGAAAGPMTTTLPPTGMNRRDRERGLSQAQHSLLLSRVAHLESTVAAAAGAGGLIAAAGLGGSADDAAATEQRLHALEHKLERITALLQQVQQAAPAAAATSAPAPALPLGSPSSAAAPTASVPPQQSAAANAAAAASLATREPWTVREQPLVVMTYASNNVFKFCRMLESAALQRVHVRVLGWDANTATRKTGLGHKILAAAAAIAQYPDTTPVMFVDAFDVLFAQPAATMQRAFEAMHTPLLFSAEKGCWPYLDGRRHGEHMCLRFYPDSPTPYRFVNTGSWVGYASHVRHLLSAIVSGKEARAVGNANDQELVTDFFVCDHLNSLLGPTRNASAVWSRLNARNIAGTATPHPDWGVGTDLHALFARYVPGCQPTGRVQYGIRLDYRAELFQSLHNSEVDQRVHASQGLDVHVTFDPAKQAWRNRHTGTYPAVLHGNGGGKLHIDPVFDRLAATARRTAAGAGAGVGAGGVTTTTTSATTSTSTTTAPQTGAPRGPAEYDQYFHFDGHPHFSFQETCIDRPPDR